MTSRREVLKLGVVGAAALTGVAASGDEPTQSTSLITRSQLAAANMPMPYTALFRRPPELVPYQTGFDGGDPARPFARYALTQKLGQAQFVPGLSPRWPGTTESFPAPPSAFRRAPGPRCGSATHSRARPAPPGTFNTVTHLHGSASLPQYDGYANDRTAPGKFKNYHYPNWQAARTLWYHDHNHLVTAQGVYSGLAAFYPLSDRFERAQLPQGEFDVPLMVSDALFNADGSLGYNDNGHDGLWGDIIMVNGVPWPTMKVKPRIYRFRVLVASITRSYRPALSNGEPVYMVATDGGMMPKVQAVSSWRQGTAERYEVLIDFRKYRPGQTVDLRNLSNKNNVDFANTDKIMRFQVVADSGSSAGYHRFHPGDAGRRRHAPKRPGRHRHDEPDPGDGRGQARAQRAAPGRGMDHQRGDLGGRGKVGLHQVLRQSRSATPWNSGPSSTSPAAGSTRCTST